MNIDSKDILFCIVLYNSNLNESASFLSIQNIVLNSSLDITFYIHNNSPNYWRYHNEKYSNFKINYFENDNNVGLSKAYNNAAIFAKEKNFKWMLLLDQDTELPSQIIEEYVKAIKDNSNIFLFTPIVKVKNSNLILSPFNYFLEKGFHSKNIKKGINNFKKFKVINSSLLISTDKFIEVGGYNENIRLDFSDYYFISKYMKNYKHFFVIDSICYQNFSNFDTDINKVISRYKLFCEGAKEYSKSNFISCSISLFLISFFRALSLTFKFRSPRFLIVFFNYL